MTTVRIDPARLGWPLVAQLFWAGADRDWEWEALLADGKLHLYCYVQDTVVALAPFEVETAPGGGLPI